MTISPWYFEPRDRVYHTTHGLGIILSRSSTIEVAWDTGETSTLQAEELEDLRLAQDVVVGLSVSDHTFMAPDGYYARWYVCVRAGGRQFSHRTQFGKSGTRASRPDQRHLAEKLAARVRAAGLPATHYSSSPHWVEVRTTPANA